MIEKTQKSILISYAEIKEKFGIKETIWSISPHVEIKESGKFNDCIGIEVMLGDSNEQTKDL